MKAQSRAELVALFGEPVIEGNLEPQAAASRGEAPGGIPLMPVDFASLPPTPPPIPGAGRWMMWKPIGYESARVAFSADIDDEFSWHLVEPD